MMVKLHTDIMDYPVQPIHQAADNSYNNFRSRFLDDSPEDRSFSNLQTEYRLSEKNLLEEAFKREMMKSSTSIVCFEFSTEEIYAAIYFICFLKDFEIPQRFYLVVCFMLNKNNRSVLMFFMPAEGIKEIALIKQTLESNIQSMISEKLKQEPFDKDTLMYFYKCCLHLGNQFFTMGIKKKLLKYLPGLDAFDVNPSNTENQIRNSHLDHLEIDAEGSIYDRARDPPGQRSVYIPPGDTASEKYRLSTFIKFPSESPANPRELANAGFFYTGYKDRVKCFSCSRGVENWQSDDDVKHSSWHRDNCDFYYGRDTTNIPIAIRRGDVRVMAGQSSSSSARARDDSNTGSSGPVQQPSAPSAGPPPNEIPSAGEALVGGAGGDAATYQTARAVGGNRRMLSYLENFTLASTSSTEFERQLKSLDLRREEDRLRSFRDWDDDSVSRNDLARDGFFYLGNYDRVQCFSCGGILRNWHRGDIVRNEHISHFPTCRMVRGQEQRNRPIHRPQHAGLPNDPGRNDMFPCLYPVNAHMRELQSRMATFDRRWTMEHHICATKTEIAQAGFYFLGERDRVKCWYCNGGLQNWEPNDDPWTEHAKWFPQCEFLLRSKGLDFVHRLVAQFPDLPRPVLRNPYDVPPEGPNHQNRNNPSPPPPIIDPRADEQEEMRKVEELMNSEIVQSVIEMGYTTQIVKKVLLTRMRDSLPEYTSVSTLVDDVTNAEENEEEVPTMLPLTLSPPRDASGPSSSSTTSQQDPERRIQELQDERKCKVCLDRMAEVVFIPCGHLCCCMSCAAAMKKCPICRKKIEQSIRTYQS